jgi:hypothetical protein
VKYICVFQYDVIINMIFAQICLNTTQYEIKKVNSWTIWLFYILGHPNIQKIVKVLPLHCWYGLSSKTSHLGKETNLPHHKWASSALSHVLE